MNKKNRCHFKKMYLINTLCLLLAAALFFAGCSSPSNENKNADSGEKTAQTLKENPSDSDGQTGEDSASDEQASSGEDFSFSQPLTLKAPEPAAGENPRILFVGNSHTYTNDLPVIFSEIAGAMGHPADVQEITEGAYTLTQFADETDEVGSVVNQKLTEETWDFVILQENTNDAFSSAEETMLPAAPL